MPAEELSTIVKNVGTMSSFQDANTYARIYELNNGHFILFPAVGSKGLLIEDRTTLDSILATRIPIEEERRNPVMEKQRLLSTLPHAAVEAIEFLNKTLGTSIHPKTLEFDTEDLNKKVRKYGFLKTYEELSVELGILLCEVLRKQEKGLDYVFEKKYGYNPYFDVVLKDSKQQEICPWYYLNRYLIEKKKFNWNEIQEKTVHFRI